MDLQISQSFVYERKGDSAVILRCFSHDSRAEIPEQIDGLVVKALAPYAFSAMRSAGTSVGVSARASAAMKDRSATDNLASGASDTDNEAGSENRAPTLCGDQLEEVILPSTIEHVGRYCFYNCHHLKRLEFPGTLHDWGSGAFSGCHQIRELRVYMEPEEDSGLKQVLDELPEKLTVEFCQMERALAPDFSLDEGMTDKKSEYARLVFPDFYEEGVENTPARILETHVHGSGILFRNCFQGKRFDFAQYDRLFPYANAQENEAVLTELVLDRLRWPYRLELQAQKTYEEYAGAHLLQFGKYFLSEKGKEESNEAFISEKSGEGLQWFLERFFVSQKATDGEKRISQNPEAVLEELSEYAARLGDAQAISRLMEFQRSRIQAAPRRKRLKL